MKLFFRVLEGAFAVIALALISMFLSYAWPDDRYGMTAWVQAIGSIVAIVAAFMIARSQSLEGDRKRELDRVAQEADLCRTALSISIEARQCLATILRKFKSATPPAHVGTDRTVELLIALRSLADKNLIYKVHSRVLVLQCELAYTLTAVKQHNSGMPITAERVDKAEKRHNKVLDASDFLFNLAAEYKVPEVIPGTF
jgi:uncharacterized membrane protein